MWLGKLFGTRRREAEIDLDEEPARFAAPPLTREPAGLQADVKRRLAEPPAAATPSKGFDPYNSGTFKKKDNAWERVVRR